MSVCSSQSEYVVVGMNASRVAAGSHQGTPSLVRLGEGLSHGGIRVCRRRPPGPNRTAGPRCPNAGSKWELRSDADADRRTSDRQIRCCDHGARADLCRGSKLFVPDRESRKTARSLLKNVSGEAEDDWAGPPPTHAPKYSTRRSGALASSGSGSLVEGAAWVGAAGLSLQIVAPAASNAPLLGADDDGADLPGSGYVADRIRDLVQ
jgi:hypothetical protein